MVIDRFRSGYLKLSPDWTDMRPFFQLQVIAFFTAYCGYCIDIRSLYANLEYTDENTFVNNYAEVLRIDKYNHRSGMF